MLMLANISNGLVFPHDGVCFFMSTYGHHAKLGYFRIDAMPWSAVIHLMNNGEIAIIDATRGDKSLTDAQRYGVPTWCMVYNRAIRAKSDRVCDWETDAMRRVASSNYHKKLIRSIRKLAKYYRPTRPAVIGQNVHLICHRRFQFDDRVQWNLVYWKNSGNASRGDQIWVRM